ncbi:MAG TPA: hypothetical protein VFY71_01890 [Planctomycetota bacterium]|nr:hypothetical protein [Planctomycetota bacterium]
MTTTLRTWIAAVALAFSGFVLTLSSDPAELGGRALAPMLVIFIVAWLIAVGERAAVPRGGLRVPRFPLGPRLLQVRPGLGGQYVALILVLGVVAGPKVAGWAALITAMVTIHAVRKVAWYVVPAAWLVNTLATMPEFHTLGDLVGDAGLWMKSLVVFGLEALVLCGPLLRTDVGGPMPTRERTLTLLAGLPAWAAACLVFTHTLAAGQYSDAEALAVMLLAGGLLQSLILGAVNWLVSIDDRSADSLPHVSAASVGIALMPLLLPILACVGLHVLPLPAETTFGGTPSSWIGLMAVLMIVPAVPAAGLVGTALDRLDGNGRGLRITIASGVLLGLWFLFGPWALAEMYAPGRVADALRAAFPVAGSAPGVVATIIPGSSPLSGHSGGQLALFGLPAADMCRAVTIMLIGLAALSARYMRHARHGQKSVGWGEHFLMATISAAGAYMLVPRLGAVGAPLACAGASAVMLALDLFHHEVLVKSPEELLAEAIAREEADLARRRAERAAMADSGPRELIT